MRHNIYFTQKVLFVGNIPINKKNEMYLIKIYILFSHINFFITNIEENVIRNIWFSFDIFLSV